MSAAPARFTFDLDLARPQRKVRTIPEDQVQRMVDEAYQAAFEQGVAQGRASVEAKAADQLASSAGTLAATLAKNVAMLAERQEEHLRESVTLSASIARKLAAHLIARQPTDELLALVTECLASLDHAPHLVIRCHPDLCDPVQKAVEERIRSSRFTGKLVVMGDPEIGLGDGRLEWADGGLVRDINAISNEINARISAYLAARSAAKTQGE